MEKRKDLLAFLLGAAACLVALCGVEYGLRVLDRRRQGAVNHFFSADYIVSHPVLGFVFAPRTTALAEKWASGRPVYLTSYSSDEYGRRITPGVSGGAAERFAIFFGDSMIFGEGLQPDETLPCAFGRRAQGTTPYNYAFQGYGPQQMYLKITDPGFAGEIAERGGVALYGYFDYHINRVVGATDILRWDPGHHPYVTLRDGVLRHQGTFLEGRKYWTWWYSLLSRLQLLRVLGIELPIITAEHRALLCEIIHQSQREFESKFPGSRFIVMLSPLSSARDDIDKTCFAARGIPYVDLRGLFGEHGDREREESPYRIPGDGHYNGRATELIAAALHDRLRADGHLAPAGAAAQPGP